MLAEVKTDDNFRIFLWIYHYYYYYVLHLKKKLSVLSNNFDTLVCIVMFPLSLYTSIVMHLNGICT